MRGELKHIARLAATGPLAVLLAGCLVGPNYEPPEPRVRPPKLRAHRQPVRPRRRLARQANQQDL